MLLLFWWYRLQLAAPGQISPPAAGCNWCVVPAGTHLVFAKAEPMLLAISGILFLHPFFPCWKWQKRASPGATLNKPLFGTKYLLLRVLRAINSCANNPWAVPPLSLQRLHVLQSGTGASDHQCSSSQYHWIRPVCIRSGSTYINRSLWPRRITQFT